jgi:hypothetical protein
MASPEKSVTNTSSASGPRLPNPVPQVSIVNLVSVERPTHHVPVVRSWMAASARRSPAPRP